MNEFDRYVGEAREFTPLLRTSGEEQWPAVREFLIGVGVDPMHAAVGDMYPDQGLLIVVVAVDGRAFELTTWHDEHDRSKFRIEDSRQLDAEARFHHSSAIYGALMILSEETQDSPDPIEILSETIERFTLTMRTEDEWSPLRRLLLEHEIEPQYAILVDWRHRLAADSPPERAGTLFFDGKWFAFIASEESPIGLLRDITAWREINKPEARDRHGAKVDAAVRLAAKEGRN